MSDVDVSGPKVFVSHCHADNEFCRPFVQRLREAGLDVWYDEDNLDPGIVNRVIGEELDRRDTFIAILSPDAIVSPWVNREIGAALDLEAEKKIKTLLFVVAQPCPVPALWRGYYRIQGANNAGVSVEEAVARIFNMFHLRGDEGLRTTQQPVRSELPPDRMPERLIQLGFLGRWIGSVEVIEPPVSLIPGGTFVIGSDSERDVLSRPDEWPASPVEIVSFSIGRFPVTVAEYACFVRSGYSPPAESLNGWTWDRQLQHLDHPVVCVTWHDARAYAEWLSGVLGSIWRLPTEAEWEKAARWDEAQGQMRRYPWGDSFVPAYCNTGPGSHPLPVGSYPRGVSPWGVYDMAGTVWEWTSTRKRPHPYVADDGREELNDAGRRVLRGGSWENDPRCARPAYRDELSPVLYDHVTGFRLARAGTSAK